MAHNFLNNRSCNDDFCFNGRIYYSQIELEEFDAKLEALCAAIELELNGHEDDIIRPSFDNDDDELFVFDSDRAFLEFYCLF
jgi:hypothetical protein